MRRDARTHSRTAAQALLLLLGASPLAGQGLGIGGDAMVYPVTRRVSYLGTVHQQTGTWMGGGASVSLGSITVAVTGLFGKVAGDSDQATNPDLDMRVSNLGVNYRATPWLALGLVAEARRQESAVGVTSWRLIGPTAHLTPPLGLRGLSGMADIAYFASASVLGSSEKISPAFRATLGVGYAPPPGRFTLSVAYRFERFDFAANGTAPARLEQFGGIVAGIGVRLGATP